MVFANNWRYLTAVRRDTQYLLDNHRPGQPCPDDIPCILQECQYCQVCNSCLCIYCGKDLNPDVGGEMCMQDCTYYRTYGPDESVNNHLDRDDSDDSQDEQTEYTINDT